MRNGHPAQPPLPQTEADLPPSIRTLFFCAGQTFAVDEDVRTFDRARKEFMAGPDDGESLWLHADHREICFSRQLLALFVFAKSREVAVQVVDEPAAVRRINEGR